MATPATATGEGRTGYGYGALLRTPGAWRFLIPGFFARQPIAMLGVGTVLLIEHTTGSYGAAGTVIAVSGVSMALLAPQGGKLADRFGQGAVLVPYVLLHALSVSALIALALARAPLWAVAAVAVPAGASIPQISPMVRARWSARLNRPGTGAPDGTEGANGTANGTGGDGARRPDGARDAGTGGRVRGCVGGRAEGRVEGDCSAAGTSTDPAGAADVADVAGAADTAGVAGSGTDAEPAGARPRGAPLMTTAAAFESVTDEFSFVVGPVLATALCTGVHPAAGLVAEAALIVAGGLVFAAQRSTQPEVRRQRSPGRRPGGGRKGRGGTRGCGDAADAERDGPYDEREGEPEGERDGARDGGLRGGRSALGVPGVRVLIAVMLGIGTVFGGMQVSAAAFTRAAGAPELNGVLYGVFATGNTCAALLVGTVRWRRSADVRLLTVYPLLVAAALTLAVAAQLAPWLPVLGGLALWLGLWVAPSMITGFTLVELLVPAAFRTEAFTWLTGAVALGQASGSMAAGRLTDAAGAGAGFCAPLAGTGLALAALVIWRRRLEAGTAGPAYGGGLGHRKAVPVD